MVVTTLTQLLIADIFLLFLLKAILLVKCHLRNHRNQLVYFLSLAFAFLFLFWDHWRLII